MSLCVWEQEREGERRSVIFLKLAPTIIEVGKSQVYKVAQEAGAQGRAGAITQVWRPPTAALLPALARSLFCSIPGFNWPTHITEDISTQHDWLIDFLAWFFKICLKSTNYHIVYD